jgi:hypothetical protein
MKQFILLIIIICPLCSYAAIYKYVDANGNYVYSDKPHPNATRIKIKENQSMSWRPVKIKDTTPTTVQQAGPTTPADLPAEFKIISPTEQQYIRSNQGALDVVTQLSSELKADQTIQAYLDNKPYGEPQTTLSFTLSGIFRGTHSLYLQLLDKASGKVLLTSNTVNFFMYRNIVKHTLLEPTPEPTPEPAPEPTPEPTNP